MKLEQEVYGKKGGEDCEIFDAEKEAERKGREKSEENG